MTSNTTGKRRVKFEVEAEKGSNVFVAGTFNEWNPQKNKLKFRDGKYATSILLPRGRYEYKFIINDTWCVDPECTEWAPNGIGSLNSTITVT